MGAANAIRAYLTYGAALGDHAMRALTYMALISADKDAEPWFGLGLEALSEFAYGRPVPGKDKDPQEHAAALRSVGRAMTELQDAGAIRTSERARFGSHRAQNARYRLYLSAPCPTGDGSEPRKWKRRPSDGQRPMASNGSAPEPPDANGPMPQDAERPMAQDDERPAGSETIGRFAVDHRTENVCPQDAERPTKEEEEEEERINNTSVADGTVEGTPAAGRLEVVEDRSVGRPQQTADRHPGERPLFPHGLPDLPGAEVSSPELPQHCGNPACDFLTRQRSVGDGSYEACPNCHPSTARSA